MVGGEAGDFGVGEGGGDEDGIDMCDFVGWSRENFHFTKDKQNSLVARINLRPECHRIVFIQYFV